MHVEVSVALNFVISYLYNKLPRRRVDMLAEALERGLKKKFQGHWYPDKPFKGSGFRCVRMNGEKVDPVFIHAATECGLSLEEVKSYLPEELTVWIDPAEVSYRIGEKGQIKILYSDRKDESTETADREVQAAGRTFNPDAQCFKPIDNLSASLNNLCLSPVMLSPSSPTSSKGWSASASTSPSSSLFNSTLSRPAPPATLVSKENVVPQFTAASFAQTKFGSTKLKTNAKRPTRLSPTEMGNYFRQRSSVLHPPASYSPQRPRSLSPRDPRYEFYMDQKNRVFLSQQQLHHQQLQQMQQQHLLQSPQHGGASPSSPHSDSGFMRSPMSGPGFVSGHFNDYGVQASSPLGSPANSAAVSPEAEKSFMDGINLNNISYTAQFPHMLLAN
ncbi:protein Tob1-like [Crassostrea virginica]|uniref:Protein Tob1-like n=1 Tax=Crassostrea virginica TaxID=6565 RepID=A0A8B8CP39_CRAVI|nr:protein Tob1-like [Crassostrea virginica]XP_022317613.1 protein Tob1-like [Crassostrea virginica]XP_022317614.1 protein Tob1-like [Crassostrea virginica]XP_022317615.1 protein Tob1-like [Crassostrea virginica]XP_022317616.1 protein Tob1-like [Crassostrea virginica]